MATANPPFYHNCLILCFGERGFTEFHDLELDTTIRALQALETLGKCAIVQGDSQDALVSLLLVTDL